MNEVELKQKLDTVVKLAQTRILTFLGDCTNPEIISKVNEVFYKYPVVMGEREKTVSTTGKTRIIGGVAEDDQIKIPIDAVKSCSLTEEYEIDKLVGTIIHEYAHQFRKINSKYGKMFEEGFATIFAESCVNYSKLKNQNNQNQTPELFNLLNSIEYQRAESQVRGLLFVLKDKGMDVSLMLEYILGNENYFKQKCTQIFGTGFENYYNEVINLEEDKQNVNSSEQILIQLISDYIKTNNMSVSKYWANDKNKPSLTNLYFTGSPTFCAGVVAAGKESLRPDEQNLYQYFEYSTKVEREERQFADNEKTTRIQNLISQKYGLNGKTSEQIHEALMDICSDYIQFKNRTDEEGMIYLEEIKKVIPNIEEFSATFKQLRVSGLDKKVIENLDLTNLSYSSIFATMDSLIPKPQVEIQNSPQQTPSIAPEQKQQSTQTSHEYTQNNSVADFQQARMSEIERRSVERNQQLAYIIAKKNNPSELEQYAQSIEGGWRKK